MKKGQVGYLVDVIAFFGLVIILVLFSIIFAYIGSSSEFEVHGKIHHHDASMQVMEVLQTSVEIEGYKATYGEFIALASYDEQLQESVEKRLELLLEKIYDKTGMHIVIANQKVENGGHYSPETLSTRSDFQTFWHTIPYPGGKTVPLEVTVAHKRGFEE